MTNEFDFDICQNNVMAKIILIAINQKNVRVYLQQNIFFYMGGHVIHIVIRSFEISTYC